jgi:4a-hydroxytetrahydrobiopterin dehydratase
MNQQEIETKLKSLSGWKFENNSLVKEIERKDFIDSVLFLLRIAVEAEKMDHHPDVLIHAYNQVKITLSTHSKGGVTTNDFELAEKINKLQ